jgi:hypothetical protein
LPKYYVEIYLPNAARPESSYESTSFDDAFGWIERHLRENPTYIGRMQTPDPITIEQGAKLARYKIERT